MEVVILDEKKLQFIKDFISTLGFPIVVTIWLLWERWTLIQQLTQTISKNTEVVQQLINQIK
jgi:hypothetical protein